MKEFVNGKFAKEEQLAYEEFEKFAKNYQRVYYKYIPTEYGSHFDVFAANCTGGCEVIELKLRDSNAIKYKDCFIEPKKYENLMSDWENNSCMPIYINFIGDYKDVYVWYLPEVTGYTYYDKVKVDGEWVSRYGLSWDDARHYKWNDELNEYTITRPIKVNKLNKKARQIKKWEQ